jgi:pimeloyl-ACP methyl ester carboxylesterase
MKFRFFFFAACLASQSALYAQGVTLTASDGLKISAKLSPGKGSQGTLIIMAPGFSQSKSTPIMLHAERLLLAYGEVLSLDFRGTGQSEGRYSFGGSEHLDLEAAFKWAKPRYKDIELIGFSMGGYISLRAASEFPGTVKRLYLVSAPSSPRDIALALGPLRQLLSLPFKPEIRALRKWAGSDYFFRWGKVFSRKPKGEALAAALKVPVAFLVGQNDLLVPPHLSYKLFNAVPGMKLMHVIKGGHHAEYLPVMNEKEFLNWFEESRKILSAPKKSRP